MNEPTKLQRWWLLSDLPQGQFVGRGWPTPLAFYTKRLWDKLMTEAQFVGGCWVFQFVPGSEALSLPCFIGYSSGGISGVLAALWVPSFLPQSSCSCGSVLVRFQGQEWMNHFIKG